jgi:hypothetical protein
MTSACDSPGGTPATFDCTRSYVRGRPVGLLGCDKLHDILSSLVTEGLSRCSLKGGEME